MAAVVAVIWSSPSLRWLPAYEAYLWRWKHQVDVLEWVIPHPASTHHPACTWAKRRGMVHRCVTGGRGRTGESLAYAVSQAQAYNLAQAHRRRVTSLVFPLLIVLPWRAEAGAVIDLALTHGKIVIAQYPDERPLVLNGHARPHAFSP